jgi:hypothetical protein
MKLFTKEINNKLFAQYPKGGNLEDQMVVAKLFNPYGRGTWYLINSDPNEPDYIWAIVDLMDVEVGSVSRSELQNLRVPPYNLPLERDMSFGERNAQELFNGLEAGKFYESGGSIGRDNKLMLDNQAIQLRHHTDELLNVLKSAKEIEPWVIAKAERAATDLSDITHYLDGRNKETNEDEIDSFDLGGEISTALGDTLYKTKESLEAGLKYMTKDVARYFMILKNEGTGEWLMTPTRRAKQFINEGWAYVGFPAWGKVYESQYAGKDIFKARRGVDLGASFEKFKKMQQPEGSDKEYEELIDDIVNLANSKSLEYDATIDLLRERKIYSDEFIKGLQDYAEGANYHNIAEACYDILRGKVILKDGGDLKASDMEEKLEVYFKQFPDDATSWRQATDEIKDIARASRMALNDIDNKEIEPLDFKSLTTPSEWNTKGKEYTRESIKMMSDDAKSEFYKEIEDFIEPDKMAMGGAIKLKEGRVYDWTIGAAPLSVKYIGLADEHKDKKPGSNYGKGFIFEWLDEPGKYVEMSRLGMRDALREKDYEDDINEILKGKMMNLYQLGVKEPITIKIEGAIITEKSYRYRDVVLATKGGTEERFPLDKLEDFLSGKKIELGPINEPYMIELTEKVMSDGGQLKVGDEVFEYKRINAGEDKRKVGGTGKIVSIVDAMAKVKYEKDNIEEFIPLKDLKKSGSKITESDIVGEIKQFEKYNYPKPKTKGDRVRAIFEHLSKKGYSKQEINRALSEMKYAEGGRVKENDVKVGTKLKHKLTGAEMVITKVKGSKIESEITKLGDLKGAKVGDTNKTSKFLIGKTYEIDAGDKMESGGKTGSKWRVTFENQDDEEFENIVVTAKNKQEAIKIAENKFRPLEGGWVYVSVEEEMEKGGETKFKDKVAAVKASLLKRKKVSPKVQKDYGKTYSPAEAQESAERIVGAQTARERIIYRMKKKK